jgi:general secretion pathway protein E
VEPKDIAKEIEQWDPSRNWKKAKGCKRCHGTGYLGRIGIYEALKISNEIQKLIGQNASADDVYKVACEQGFRNLREDGLLKASQGLTTVEEVLRVVNG